MSTRVMEDFENLKKVRLTESARYTCLEGLQEANHFTMVSSIGLDYCGWEECYPGFQFGPYIRTYYVIHFVLSGKGIYKTKTGEFRLKQGDAFLIYPGEETQYQADMKVPWKYTWIGFHGIRAEEFLSNIGFTKEKPVIHVKRLAEMEQCIKNMLNAKQLTLLNEMRRTEELWRLFGLMVEENEAENKKGQDYPSTVYVRAAIDYMMHHYSEKIRIEDLADYIGITRSHLTGLFKKKLNRSPQEYLINLRMEAAATLLKKSAEPVKAIAAKCGYEDSLSFSKAFKQRYKMGPKAYRESEVDVVRAPEKGIDLTCLRL